MKISAWCLYCQKKFLTYPCRIKTGKGKYCSKACFNKSKIKQIATPCVVCKKIFYVIPSYITKKITCSKICSSIRRKILKTGEKNPRWNGGWSAKESNLKWRKNNHQHILFLNRQREIKEKEIIGSHTNQEWLDLKEKYNYTCLSCKKREPEIKLTQDHIIPLANEKTTNYIDNIQPLCQSCNSKKWKKIIKYDF